MFYVGNPRPENWFKTRSASRAIQSNTIQDESIVTHIYIYIFGKKK